MTMQEALQKLIDADYIIITFCDWGYSREYASAYPYFNLYAMKIKPDKVEVRKIICEEHPYWSQRKGAYGMRIWGSDRYHELIYHFTDYDVNLTTELYRKTLIL